MESDHDLIVTLYLCGLSESETARQAGVHRSTVARVLQMRNVERRPPEGGPTPREFCGRGHSMAEFGRKKVNASGRECMACRRERDREWRRKKYWEAKGITEVPPSREEKRRMKEGKA